ncbi:beta-ketoacyl synthase N-terminal-like domain-containing protein [Bacillus velezensis]
MTYAWRAIEDAGCKPESLSGTNTGVFIGTGNTGYKDLFTRAGLAPEGHAATGDDDSFHWSEPFELFVKSSRAERAD